MGGEVKGISSLSRELPGAVKSMFCLLRVVMTARDSRWRCGIAMCFLRYHLLQSIPPLFSGCLGGTLASENILKRADTKKKGSVLNETGEKPSVPEKGELNVHACV